MKKIIVLIGVAAVVCMGSEILFAASVGNPLKEPAKGDFMIGGEWTLVTDKKLEHRDYSEKQEYQAYLHTAKFTYGLLDGLTVNGEFGVGRIKNVNQHVPHGYEVAWGGGFIWNLLENLHSIWSGVPKELPYGIDCGFSGSYNGIASNGDNPSPGELATANYVYDERWREFQAASWVAKDFGIFIPYGGMLLSWVHVRQKQDPNTGVITIKTLKDNSDLGVFIGLDICPGKDKNLGQIRFLKDINLSFEFRGESETAYTAGINWVWKY